VSVPGNKEWTDTGIALTAGEKVTITAEGLITYFPPKTVSPLGKAFGASGTECGKFSYPKSSFPAPGVNCWSMLFRIGTPGVPFPTGKKISFTSPQAGELFLGVNDNNLSDNSGSWTAKITTP
jgi:hypothetical protein